MQGLHVNLDMDWHHIGSEVLQSTVCHMTLFISAQCTQVMPLRGWLFRNKMHIKLSEMGKLETTEEHIRMTPEKRGHQNQPAPDHFKEKYKLEEISCTRPLILK